MTAAAQPRRDALLYKGIPLPAPNVAGRVAAYLSARQATVLGWSPRGALLIATRFGDTTQLHLVAQAGGERRQLTFYADPVAQAVFAPSIADNALVFRKDDAGNGRYQLYYQRVGAPDAQRLTDGKSVNGAAIWANSGREIAFASSTRGGRGGDIDIVMPVPGAAARLLVAGDGAAWVPLDWSPDDRQLLALQGASAADSHLYLLDAATGAKRELDAAAGKAAITAARFARDGLGVYLISDRDSDFQQMRYLNLVTGKTTVLSKPIAEDIVGFALSRDGHYLAYISRGGGGDQLHMIDLRTRADLTPPHLPYPGLIDSLHFDAAAQRLAFDLSAPNRPCDAYVLTVANEQLQAWTDSEAGPVDLAKFVAPRLTNFPTFDRVAGAARRIPLYVYAPARPGPHPVLIMFHGGATAAFRPVFDPWIQYVVNELGFAVLAPNLRGSSGSGKTFASLAEGGRRDDVIKDIGALLVWLEGQREFDAKDVIVSGRSYGGYLALEALATYSDRLRGGVDFAGITDLVDYLGALGPNLQPLARSEFGDERDPDVRAYLRNLSPLAMADRITKPVLIVHGQNDPLVPAGEAESMVSLLQSHGVRVGYLLAKDEGHRFVRQRDRLAYYTAFAQFLDSVR